MGFKINSERVKFRKKYCKVIKNRSDNDALIKLVRLLANLMTVEKIGTDFIINRMAYFKDILRKTKAILSFKSLDVHSVTY